jgi:hypothetical protein
MNGNALTFMLFWRTKNGNRTRRRRSPGLCEPTAGIDAKSLAEAREAGQQLSARVGKLQTVQEVGGPRATPGADQNQSTPAARYRHVQENQQQQLTGGPAAGHAAAVAEQGQAANQNAGKSISREANNSKVADIAKSLRQSGVAESRSAGEVSRPAPTPEVAKRQSRGRGR